MTVARLRGAAARAVRRAFRAVGRLMPVAVRRSLRVRVVVLTLLLGTAVVYAVGNLVLEDIASRLAETRREQAEIESANAVALVQDAFANSPDLDDRATVEATLLRVLPQLEGSATDRLRQYVLHRAPDNTSPIAVGTQISPTLAADPVTRELRAAVAPAPEDPTRVVQRVQLVPLSTGRGDATVPAVVVGSRVDLPPAGAYELYLVYEMRDEVATLALVQRALVVGGVALVLLVATIAWLIARLVARPVQVAAHTAEQLAAGELDRRMVVRGHDEVARLATSFNVMAASLQAQITRLETLSRLQQRFVADVSHELRTPLTTIRMAADVLSDRLTDPDAGPDTAEHPDVRRSSELLSTQIDRFEQLLADLLEVSRFDAGAAALDLVDDVDLVEVVRQGVDLIRPVADRAGVPLVVRGPDGGPPQEARLEADPRRVGRVLRNLLSNAVEHAEGGAVEITVAVSAEAVSVGVRDHGSGLSPTDQERVFDRFWRADPSRRRTLGGTGLGLAISLEDARLHAGRLEVWSRAGEGSHFVLTLPRRARGSVTRAPLRTEPADVSPGPAGATAAAALLPGPAAPEPTVPGPSPQDPPGRPTPVTTAGVGR
ncbi:MAG: MtrAB system histidine kinase MtrB [Kineosporiaceae bacterium]